MVVPERTDVEELCQRLPEGCELWLGGAAITCLCAKSLPTACRKLTSAEALRARARDLYNA